MSISEFEQRLAATAAAVETCLARSLDGAGPVLPAAPERLLRAMRHGALDGGKRLRPFLLLESARLFGADPDKALGAATALECVHCYSLVHDDLPAMDDDAVRRGKPTVHKAFDEATAILAGDSLLTLAFGLIADEDGLSASARLGLVALVSRDAGAAGMAGGQALDLEAEGRALSEDEIATMQAMKTGALIACACEAGPVIADAAADDRARLRRFGEIVGLAFQLADDLLDETADAATLGKAAGKDRGRGKKTLPALNGIAWTQDRLAELVTQAEAELAPYGAKATTLIATARFVADRRS
ncbi:polyprenyl synthetase family protein [Aurantimonas marianensis]|uniref:Probable farnesyl diphosphate synthase n=1 Tax=Aurantimonas marianensis TaxID=2920428 RepID=A0A9X2H427_9HYPH|nr:farnesyl diphosphate synthase [Aurantimonas marianensis]MCP3053676.1 polyprenyl synthetase family protein [Aurantimonas marianensis]